MTQDDNFVYNMISVYEKKKHFQMIHFTHVQDYILKLKIMSSHTCFQI